jgi:hypothetical protein
MEKELTQEQLDIKNRIKDGLAYAKKVVEVLDVIGIPSDFGFVWNKSGAEYTNDIINGVVTVKMGPNYQFVANTERKKVTVFRGRTWMTLIEEAYDKHVKDKVDPRNSSTHRLLENLDLK